MIDQDSDFNGESYRKKPLGYKKKLCPISQENMYDFSLPSILFVSWRFPWMSHSSRYFAHITVGFLARNIFMQLIFLHLESLLSQQRSENKEQG